MDFFVYTYLLVINRKFCNIQLNEISDDLVLFKNQYCYVTIFRTAL